VSVLDNLPDYDDPRLLSIQKNAVRLINTGDASQRSQAHQVLAAITAELLKRSSHDYPPSTSRRDMEFEGVWSRMANRLVPPMTIQNWGIDQQYTGGTFNIQAIGDS
jgi:hypothetical protein